MVARDSERSFSDETLEEMIAGGESETVEFKRHLPPDRIISQVLTAFANGEGGVLLIGIGERGEVLGLRPDEAQHALERMKHIVSSLFDGVDWLVCAQFFRDRSIAYAFVGPAPEHVKPVATSRGKVYVRRGAANVVRSPDAITPKTKAMTRVTVFVAMSFREEEEPGLVDYWQAMMRAARSVSNDLEIRRIDLKDGDFEISQEIMAEIDTADVVIADFTLSSRNVYFELGYARGKGKRLIQTARKGTDLEFDVRNWKTLFYRNATELEEKLGVAFKALLFPAAG